MRKRRWTAPALVLALLLLVTACGTETPEATPTPEPTNTPAATEASPSQEVLPTPAATADPSEPVVVTPPEEVGVCEPAPLPELAVPPVDETDWVKGADPDEAEVIIYEYSDFQCPGCAGMYPVLNDFLGVNPGVSLVYRHFPLDFHQHAMITSEAAEAAGAQGKFWEMHNLLFDKTQEWVPMSEEEIREALTGYAEELDLDVDEFNRALDDGVYTEAVRAEYDDARELALPGTPTFIFNNVLFPSDIGLSFQGLMAFLNIMQQQDDLFYDGPPEVTVSAEDSYEAVLTTSQGDIRIRLLPESAPTHVNSFVFLARDDWYGGSDFFFVRDNFVAVTGDPTNSSVGYPGYYCTGEEQSTFDRPGLVGMLSNGQFFLTLGADAAQLNGQFALVGQVIEGFDVLDQLTRRVVGDPNAAEADVLESIEVIQN
ncbi:MAG: peptidylprolyl isomerase [Anaerolineae bacterium]